MWFGTPSGISSLSKGRWESYRVRDGLPSENINCLLQDSTGMLWAGTAAGIAFRDHGLFRIPPRVPPELSAPVLGITEDRYGWLWFATSSHVFRVHREQLWRGSLGDGDLREYGIADGLRGTEGVKRHQSVFRDRLDRIWFSLHRGISFVDPTRLTRNSVPTIVHVQAVNGNPIHIGTVTLIPGGQQRVTFNFAALSFSAADRIRYRYMLEGYDRDWERSRRRAGRIVYQSFSARLSLPRKGKQSRWLLEPVRIGDRHQSERAVLADLVALAQALWPP